MEGAFIQKKAFATFPLIVTNASSRSGVRLDRERAVTGKDLSGIAALIGTR